MGSGEIVTLTRCDARDRFHAKLVFAHEHGMPEDGCWIASREQGSVQGPQPDPKQPLAPSRGLRAVAPEDDLYASSPEIRKESSEQLHLNRQRLEATAGRVMQVLNLT